MGHHLIGSFPIELGCTNSLFSKDGVVRRKSFGETTFYC